ncbi:DUF6600 domain-containing protein [Mucilaginibacter celer]|uniref:YXWGXW repeat-containing protein n=1 Tax=Mucilaginibacter celer TaxID=2305508 RepID=A0A494W2X0_9SPHI|nr:DUF6600 domain-containing protein [Mucilaginibacter celer]AYL97888.1 hypothetical protein HYN43_022465 [Mucilaginibacter celer]
MKFINKICGISLIAFLIMLAAPDKSKAQEGGYVSDQEFYDELDPYGTWVSDPQYGNVWVPDAEDNFRPYATRGHWVVTDYGNTWVSDYKWGWAPFHYGRWRYDDYYGWEWIPGNEWAPAWVSWRHGGGYYGWAPLQPGISISISLGNSYRVPDNYWVCAPQAYINSPQIYNYYTPRPRVVNIINRTTIINNTYVNNNRTYITGPRVTEIRQVTNNRNVRVYNITNVNRPNGGGRVVNNTVNIYRPEVRKAPDARPARVVNAAAYRQQNPNAGIANRGRGNEAVNRNNAARLREVARNEKPDNKLVQVNHDRPAARPNPADNRGQGQPANRQQQLQQRQQEQQKRQQDQQASRQQQLQQRQQAQQQREQQRQAGKPADEQANRQQQLQQRQQQAQQRQQEQQAQRQQQLQQRQQEQQAQRQQQQQQREQEQQVQRQQQQQQRQQEQQAQRQQQAQQRQQEQQAQRQQQLQQRQQEQQQRQQQMQQQRQQEQQAQREQQMQQRQQEQQQRQQQMQQQRQQEQQQRQQQMQQQRQQQQQQRQQEQQRRPAN